MKTDDTTPLATADTLAGLVTLAWATFSSLDLVQVEAMPVADDVVCSSVAITGPRCATVKFFVDPALARFSTSMMLDTPPDALDDADVHDVMGEIVNIIGGNLKGAVSDDTTEWRLSLPVVSNSMQSAPGGRMVSHVSFLTEEGTVGCQIVEQT